MCCHLFCWNIRKFCLSFLTALYETQRAPLYRTLQMLDTGKLLTLLSLNHKHIKITIYRLIFGIESCDRKVLLSRLVGFVCERNAHALVLADSGIGANKSSVQADLTTSALMILSDINRKYPREMKNDGLQMMVGVLK